jgi:hypothetical protein
MDELVNLNLTVSEIDTLLHFATLGQNMAVTRNNYGDREVAKELDPVVSKVIRQMIGYPEN